MQRKPLCIENMATWRAVNCRFQGQITRPAIANERASVNHAGQVVLKLKTAYRDGTSHIVMSPLEFMQRLAALAPRPRLHLICFHGALAPNAKLRAAIVPIPPEHTTTGHTGACSHAHGARARITWARLLKRVFDIDIERCPQCGGKLKIIAAPSTYSGQALKNSPFKVTIFFDCPLGETTIRPFFDSVTL